MRRRLLITIVGSVTAVLAASTTPAMAANVDSLPARVAVTAAETVYVTVETNYDNPDTEDVEADCTDTWTTKVISGASVIKPIAAPECDGTATYWSIGTRKGVKPKPKTTAVVEFTRTAPDGSVVSVQRLVVKVTVPKKKPAGTSGSSGSDGFATCASAGQNCVGAAA